jgi:hypothetical protein
MQEKPNCSERLLKVEILDRADVGLPLTCLHSRDFCGRIEGDEAHLFGDVSLSTTRLHLHDLPCKRPGMRETAPIVLGAMTRRAKCAPTVPQNAPAIPASDGMALANPHICAELESKIDFGYVITCVAVLPV